MATSHSTPFNTFVSVLEATHKKPTGLSHTTSSGNSCLVETISSILDKYNAKYPEILQGSRWPKAKLASSSTDNVSAFVTASSPVPPSTLKFSAAKRLLKFVPTKDLLALLLNRNDTKKVQSGLCFTPLCNSDKHCVRDCPGPFPANWDHNYHKDRSRLPPQWQTLLQQ
jgi:hypothetical protein